MEAPSRLTTSQHQSHPFRTAVAERLLVACAFSGGVHFALAPEHLGESVARGTGFLIAGSLLAMLGLGIYMRPDSSWVALSLAALTGGLIAAYVASRTVGLPLLQPGPEPVDVVGVITKAIELAAFVLSARLSMENAAGVAGRREKRRVRWTTIARVHRAGS
jgi:hypothetical protein